MVFQGAMKNIKHYKFNYSFLLQENVSYSCHRKLGNAH